MMQEWTQNINEETNIQAGRLKAAGISLNSREGIKYIGDFALNQATSVEAIDAAIKGGFGSKTMAIPATIKKSYQLITQTERQQIINSVTRHRHLSQIASDPLNNALTIKFAAKEASKIRRRLKKDALERIELMEIAPKFTLEEIDYRYNRIKENQKQLADFKADPKFNDQQGENQREAIISNIQRLIDGDFARLEIIKRNLKKLWNETQVGKIIQEGKELEIIPYRDDEEKVNGKTYFEATGEENSVEAVIGDKIHINLSLAAEVANYTPVSHGILHGVITGTFTKEQIEEGQKILFEKIPEEEINKDGEKVFPKKRYMERLDRYSYEYLQKNPDEYWTQYYELIEELGLKNDITFQRKISNYFDNILIEAGYKNIKSNPEDIIQFIHDFRKTFKKGRLPAGAVWAGEEGSKFSVEEVNNIKGLLERYQGDYIAMIADGLRKPAIKDKEGKKIDVGERVEDSEFGQSIAGLAERLTQFLFDRTPPDYLQIIPGENKRLTFKRQLITDAAMLVANEYNPELGSINQFISNRLWLRAQSLLTELGVPKTEKEGGPGVIQEFETQKYDRETDELVEPDLDDKGEVQIEPSFAEKLEISVDTQKRILKAVENTFQTPLPKLSDKKFLTAFTNKNISELKPILTSIIEKEGWANWLDRNFETILEKLPQDVINKRYDMLRAPVLTETGKQKRDDTPAGKGEFEKLKIDKKDFVDYFTNPNPDVIATVAGEITVKDKNGDTKTYRIVKPKKGKPLEENEIDGTPLIGKRIGNEITVNGQQVELAKIEIASNTRSDRRNRGLIPVLINELSFDIAIDALRNPKVQEKLAVQDIDYNELFVEELKRVIGRDKLSLNDLENRNEQINKKWSLIIEEAENQGLNEKDILKFTELYHKNPDKAYIKNPDLFVAIEDTYRKSKTGPEYRQFDILRIANKNNPNFKMVDQSPPGNDFTRIDFRIESDGENEGVEDKGDTKSFGTLGRVAGNINNLKATNPDNQLLNDILRSKEAAPFKEALSVLIKEGSKILGIKEEDFDFTAKTKFHFDKGEVEQWNNKIYVAKFKGLQAAVEKAGKFKVDGDRNIQFYVHKDSEYPGTGLTDKGFLFSFYGKTLGIDAPILKLDSQIIFRVKKERLKDDGVYKGSFYPKIVAHYSSKNITPEQGIDVSTLEKATEVFSNIKYSLENKKDIRNKINEIIEDKKNIPADKDITVEEAISWGRKNRQLQWWIPTAAEDLRGLVYRLVRKNKDGEEDLKFYDEVLFKPLNRAYTQYLTTKQRAMNDMTAVRKEISDRGIDLQAEAFDGLTNDQVIRISLWSKRGYDLTELRGKDAISEDIIVKANMHVRDLKAMDLLGIRGLLEQVYLSDGEQYPPPPENWRAGTILYDLFNRYNGVKRNEIFEPFFENAEALFGEFKQGKLVGKQANRLEAALGQHWVYVMSDMLSRIKSGRNRSYGNDVNANAFLDWTNAAVATTMFINSRSVTLQLISNLNFINGTDNNVIEAGKAYMSKDFMEYFWKIFNSDYLLQRRAGLKIDVNLDELSQAAEGTGNTSRFAAIVSAILKKGFLPTQIADSAAIAWGGAPFLMNRQKTYIKQGMSEQEAYDQAFEEFMDLSEDSQQASRPDKISMQQASSVGKLVLSFQNYPMQAARLQKRRWQDLLAGRGSVFNNARRIIWYGAVQNIIFHALQKAAFAIWWNDEAKDEEEEKRLWMVLNGVADTFLAGSGYAGMIAAMGKNVILELIDEFSKEDGRPDTREALVKATSFSPAINAKLRLLNNAMKRWEYKDNRKNYDELNIDNPILRSAAEVTEFTVNLPANRIVNKLENIMDALDKETEWWRKIFLMMGWSSWDLFMEDYQHETLPKLNGLKGPKIRDRKIKPRKVK